MSRHGNSSVGGGPRRLVGLQHPRVLVKVVQHLFGFSGKGAEPAAVNQIFVVIDK